MLRVTNLSGFGAASEEVFSPPVTQDLSPTLLTNTSTIYNPTIADDWIVAFNQTLSGTDNAWTGLTLKTLIPASLISAGGTQIRVTVKAGIGEGCSLTKLYIGEKAAAGDDIDMKSSSPSPTQLLFSGSGSVLMASAGATAVSDALTFTLDETKDYVFGAYISGDTSNDNIAVQGSVTGAAARYKSGDEAATADVTSYSAVGTGSNVVGLITKIEVRG